MLQIWGWTRSVHKANFGFTTSTQNTSLQDHRSACSCSFGPLLDFKSNTSYCERLNGAFSKILNTLFFGEPGHAVYDEMDQMDLYNSKTKCTSDCAALKTGKNPLVLHHSGWEVLKVIVTGWYFEQLLVICFLAHKESNKSVTLKNQVVT